MFVPPKRIKQEYAISTSCLRKWALQGKVGFTQLPGGKRLYNQTDLARLPGDITSSRRQQEKAKVVYARVSSSHQKEDLERQIQDLRQAYSGHRVLSDVGSGPGGPVRRLELMSTGNTSMDAHVCVADLTKPLNPSCLWYPGQPRARPLGPADAGGEAITAFTAVGYLVWAA